ncbi:MAG: anthranilate synthase component I family protein [Caulobacteraceae bacterium]
METAAFIKGNWREPAEVLAAFAEEAWTFALLSDGKGEQGRWSYVARHPDAVLVVRPEDDADAFAELAALLGQRQDNERGGPPMQGGVIGLAAYELGDRAEGIGLARYPGWPDLIAARYPALLAFDHQNREVVAVGRGENELANLEYAHEAMGWLREAAWRARRQGPLALAPTADDPALYENAVRDVVARISAGEIFQANIARRWRGELVAGAKPSDLAVRLARDSAAPFAAYLRLEEQAVVCNSPERFLKTGPEGEIESRPIKGTARRGTDAAEDARLAQALARSAKDQAENLMIVDLMRNDLSRVAAGGSVETSELYRVETFANVHHLVSTVTARLAEGKSAVDLLRAALPAGSITGAPKVQAMKVIAALEPPRGPFFGAMFWAGFNGAMDANVMIRTALFEKKGDAWRFEARAGAGLIADSDPAAERMETEDKMAALLKALSG